jgi:DNA (cytosine-5)-methyltransferase 1
MIYGSVCSGLEAATVAWAPLGWAPAFFSEIEKFPRALLQHHYPDVPLHGDFTTIEKNQYGKIDLLVGGTPCQSFSVAGLRGGLDDPRGNLTLGFINTVRKLEPTWIVWENVPGVLSSDKGRDFGSFLGALAELGYGFAYRVLDAQYFGVPQRRRRVFVVAHSRNAAYPAAVLFERHSLQGHPAPSLETREETTGAAVSSLDASYGRLHGTSGQDLNHGHSHLIAGTLTRHAGTGPGPDEARANHLVAQFQAFGEYKMSDTAVSPIKERDHQRRFTDVVLSVHGTQDPDINLELAHPLGRNQGGENAIAWNEELNAHIEQMPNLTRGGEGGRHDGVMQNMSVRRLTPVECERLMGFPDEYTRIPWRNKPAENCPDGHRYKALGNSMAVPVVRWIGARIEYVDRLARIIK